MKAIRIIWNMTLSVVMLLLFSCADDQAMPSMATNVNATEAMMKEDGDNPDEAIFDDLPANVQFRGNIYIGGNEHVTNQIHLYTFNQDGILLYRGMFGSGGAGTNIPLDSQGAVVLSSDKNYLYAVNAGSNSVSSFKIDSEGIPTLLYTTPTGGMTPVSVTINGNLLYVVHAGNGTINGFYVDVDGKFTNIPGSEQKLSDDTSIPAKIAFSPNGLHLYVTERKTNKISIFDIDSNGAAGIGNTIASTGLTPSGFEYARNNFMVVANSGIGIQAQSSATCYQNISDGNLNPVNGLVANSQTLSAWVTATVNGRYTFISNPGSNTISSYYVANTGEMYLAKSDIPVPHAPNDIVISSNNYNVFVLCAQARTIQRYVRAPLGDLIHVGQTYGIPDSVSGIACF